jgi:phage gp16-like protein
VKLQKEVAMSQAKDKFRNVELAKIHILAKKNLGMNDDEYRCMLRQITGKESSAKLNWRQRAEVIDHLRSLIDGPKYPGRPHNMDSYNSRAAQLGKIEALLTIGGKPWAYGDALAQRICKVERLAWVPDGELYKIITALRMQAKREGWELNE